MKKISLRNSLIAVVTYHEGHIVTMLHCAPELLRVLPDHLEKVPITALKGGYIPVG